VKSRGTWGEIQLGTLLDDMLSAEQFVRNAQIRPRSTERVEFAIRLPGKDDNDTEVLLPIDSKFPREDYERLIQAQENADPIAAAEAGQQLEIQIKKCAREIREKYIHPPHSTDFGILFLPVESLFAEVLRRPGLIDWLQQECRVTVAGPTTLCALMNSLQMGFRTLAVQKRSSEVWKVLGAVKTEFGRFGDMLDKVSKQLKTAQNTIDDATSKTKTIHGKLKSVEQLSAADARAVLGQELIAPSSDLETVAPESVTEEID
jgi:DNA recombination protein RmuC